MVRHAIENPQAIQNGIESDPEPSNKSKSILAIVLSITVKAWNNFPISTEDFLHVLFLFFITSYERISD